MKTSRKMFVELVPFSIIFISVSGVKDPVALMYIIICYFAADAKYYISLDN